jgi:hypothetical protein
MPTAVAKIFDKVVGGVSDHTLILAPRCQLVYPIEAPNWQDLRVGFLLSLCGDANPTEDDDPVTGIGPETVTGGNDPGPAFSWIGIKTNNDSLPTAPTVGFIGYSAYSEISQFDSELVSSDSGIGTITTNFWRPRSVRLGIPDNSTSAVIMDTGDLMGGGVFTNVNPHFVQNVAGAGGYATLLMLRIQRTNSLHGPSLTVSIKQGTHSSDVLFTSTPTLDLLESNMANYPTTVQSHQVNRVVHVPDALYCYWPFHNSRLRVHALGFMKFR